MSNTKTTDKPSSKAREFSPSELMPDLGSPEVRAVSANRAAYWVGLLADAPVDQLTSAGISFQKATMYHVDGDRHQQVGCIVRMSAEQVQQLRERLSRLVIRVTNSGAREPEPVGMQSKPEQGIGDMQGIESMKKGREKRWGNRRGYVITIPTEEEIAERIKHGRPTGAYEPQQNDEPAARYMYAVKCDNQKNPRPGSLAPRPLSEVGIELP